jgi:hypothetical protein
MNKISLQSFSPSIFIWIVIFLVNSISIYLTFKFNWWENLSIKQIDIYILIYSLFYFIFRKYLISILFLFAFLVFINLHGIAPIASNFLLFIFSFFIGYGFLKLIRINNLNLVSLTTLSVGLGVISLIINFFSYFKINTPIIYFLIFSSISLLIFYLNKTYILDIFSKIKIKKFYIETNFFFSTIFIFLFCYSFLAIILPDTSHDGLSTHLTIPKQLFLNKIWNYNVDDYVWAVQPMGGQWLFSFLFFFGGEPAVKLFPLLILLSLSYFTYYFLKENSLNNDISFSASLILFSLPMTHLLFKSLHIDTIHAFFSVVILIEILKEKRDWKILSILMGICFALKSSTILLVPLILHFYIVDSMKSFSLKNTIIYIFLGLLFCLAPYLTAFLKTGSPTFPLYNEIFKSELISKAAFYHPLFSQQSFADIFYTTFNSKNYGIAHYSNGAIGLGFFIFGIIVLFNFLKIDKTKYVLFFYYFFAMAIMFIFQSYLRYIYFLLAPLIYLLVISINNNLKEKKIILFTLFLILSVNVIKYDKISVALKDDINIYLSKDNLINYDLEQQPLKRLGNYINKTAAFENKKIFILSKYNQPQYYHFDTKVDFWTWHSLSIQLEIINSGNLEKSLKKKDFHYLVLENNFDAKILSQFIRDDIQKIGEFHSKYENFIIKKLN